jgi:hypothetical protein
MARRPMRATPAREGATTARAAPDPGQEGGRLGTRRVPPGRRDPVRLPARLHGLPELLRDDPQGRGLDANLLCLLAG